MHADRYIRKPVPSHVVFAAEGGVLQTLEGPVAYAPGDAIVTGVAGERWPVPRDRFERTYRPADPQGAMGKAGRFLRQSVVVQAAQAETDARIALSGGRGYLSARPGDWVLTDPDGETWVVAERIFRETYEPLAPGSG